MKLFLLTVILLTAVCTNCRDELKPPDRQNLNETEQPKPDQPLIADLITTEIQPKDFRERKQFHLDTKNGRGIKKGDGCKIKLPCAVAGGHCITNPYDCRYGRLVPTGCGGKLCQCCIPGCPVKDGFFWLASSRQCFKLMTDNPSLDWDDGKALCEGEKLKLAHPYNAIDLRSYLSQRYGHYQAYINAQGNGNQFVWQDDEVAINNNSPLWISKPVNPGPDKCLILQFTEANEAANTKPYWATDCATTLDYRYALCEYENIFQEA